MVRFERMSKWSVEANLVDVVAALLVADDISGFHQISDDAVDGSLSDSHETADVHETDLRVLRDTEQHVGMVGEECPRWDCAVSALRAEFHDAIVPRVEISRRA